MIPKKLDDRVIHDGMFPSSLPIMSNKNRFMKHSLIFFLGIIIRKCFSKVAKITEISASSENCQMVIRRLVTVKQYFISLNDCHPVYKAACVSLCCISPTLGLTVAKGLD